MRVFISGIAGFLGSHLAEVFRDNDHDVVGCDTLLGGDRDNVPAGVEFHPADCCDVPTMRRLTAGVELVYHCAALATEGLSVFSPAVVCHNSFEATAGLLAGAIGSGVKRFVFCSSMARYGGQATPFRETQVPQPVDPYGVSKYASEMLVANLCQAHDVEWTVAVPHNIYGPRQKYDDPYRNVVGIITNRMLLGKRPIIYGDGSQMRCFSYVSDCIAPLVQLGCLAGISGEVFNIGPDEGTVTIRELVTLVSELLDFADPPQFVPGRPREIQQATCSADKARARLGYQTEVVLRDGLERTIAWIRNRGPRPFQYYLPIEIDVPSLPVTWRRHLI